MARAPIKNPDIKKTPIKNPSDIDINEDVTATWTAKISSKKI